MASKPAPHSNSALAKCISMFRVTFRNCRDLLFSILCFSISGFFFYSPFSLPQTLFAWCEYCNEYVCVTNATHSSNYLIKFLAPRGPKACRRDKKVHLTITTAQCTQRINPHVNSLACANSAYREGLLDVMLLASVQPPTQLPSCSELHWSQHKLHIQYSSWFLESAKMKVGIEKRKAYFSRAL